MHPTAIRLSTLLLSLCLGLAACQAGAPGTQGAAGGTLACTLVHLRTGPTPPADKATSDTLFAGHFRNMERLAKEGRLLLAGPYGKERHAKDLRGIFVFDTADQDEARRLGGTDPTTAAGVFVQEYHALVTDAPLRAFLAAEMRQQEALTKAGKTPAPGEFGRPFVLLTADQGELAMAALAGHPAVLLLGRLDDSKAFAILDATTQDEAKTKLGAVLVRVGPHVFDDWFASRGVAELPQLHGK